MRGTASAGERIGQGRENTRNFLKENKDIFAKMDAEVFKKAEHWRARKGRGARGSGDWPGRGQGSRARTQGLAVIIITEDKACVQSIAIIVVALALCSAAVNGTCQVSTTIENAEDSAALPQCHVRFLLLALPASAGFKVLTDRWSGAAAGGESGLQAVIRNSRWTDESPYEDIPILVFTPAQWRAVYSRVYTGAGVTGPSELGRNRKCFRTATTVRDVADDADQRTRCSGL